MKFRKDNKIATVKRLGYIENSEWYKKGGWHTLNKSYEWKLKPLTVKDGVELSNFGKEFAFHTNLWADIKESDKLIIDWAEYTVKGVAQHEGISFSRLLCILQKW